MTESVDGTLRGGVGAEDVIDAVVAQVALPGGLPWHLIHAFTAPSPIFAGCRAPPEG